MSGATHITGQEEFDSLVMNSTVPTLVDFYAEWCGPCQVAAPIMDKMADEYGDTARIIKVDVDIPENREISQQHGVMSIPTVVLYKNGKMVGDPQIGFIGESGYRAMIEEQL